MMNLEKMCLSFLEATGKKECLTGIAKITKKNSIFIFYFMFKKTKKVRGKNIMVDQPTD